MAARVGVQLEGWNLHPEHFVERHGLIVIIALGETLIVAAAGLAGAPRTMLFICGTAAALWRGTGEASGPRWILAPSAAIMVVVLGATPWVALAVVLGMLLALGIIEERTDAFGGEQVGVQ